MHPTLPLLQQVAFPALRRAELSILQVNLGYLCNLSCVHCHVNAGPRRKEIMQRETIDDVIKFLEAKNISTLDLTGGAPEMNPHFRDLVRAARALGVQVIDRCNLSILLQPGYEDMAEFLAAEGVEITASLPCYSADNVDAQRGNGVFDESITALQQLNALGYGKTDSDLILNLVYNPQGPTLPPPQQALEADYKTQLQKHFGIVFNQLFTVANMPINRFGSTLISHGQFNDYMDTLKAAHRDENLAGVMCRNTISVDWQGYVYDCDFNQMLHIPIAAGGQSSTQLRDLLSSDLSNKPIAIAGHCYGCTAGQGSSCGGALN